MTPALGLLLTTCVLLAAPAQEEDPAARAQAILQQVSKLPLEHQRAWLRLIEQRYGWAVLLTLRPEDAKREQERVAKILHQKTVGWNELLSLLRQLDQREKAAIARLVRQYRAEVYDTFRTRPRDLVDRQEAWYRIWSLWEKAGSPPQQQDRLMDWLADAIKASGKETIGPLPADPRFGDGVELVPEQLVKQLTQPPAARPEAPRQPADDFSLVPQLQARAPLPLRVPDPRQDIGPTKRTAEEAVIRRTEMSDGLPWPAETPPVVAPSLHVLPPLAADDPRDLTTPPAPSHQALLLAVQRAALQATESSTDLVAGMDSKGASPQALRSSRQPAAPPPPRMIEPPPEQSFAILPQNAAPSRPISPAESRAAEAESPPAVGPRRNEVVQLPHRLAEFAPPRPQHTAEYRVERKALRPDMAAGQSSPPATQADRHAQVNVEELGTRIEGINLSLRNLEAELNEKRDFTADQLDSLLSRLDILVLRQKDLTLFRDLITPAEQAKVGQIDSPRSVVATMGTRIAEVRTRIRADQAAPAAERTTTLAHLDELSDRLATMTTEK